MNDRLMGGARRPEKRASDEPSSQTRVLRIPVRPIVMGGSPPDPMPMMGPMGNPASMPALGSMGSSAPMPAMGPRMPGQMGGMNGMG